MEDSELLNIKIETADDYEVQSELNDMRQHANKIIQGIKRLDNNDANRAIWELFQNAVDLSEKCHVHIQITNETFEFSHNGEPFTPMTLDCLFKQVSSKTLEEKKQLYTEDDPVGQYGTGFITTHAFGKELTIDGALIKGDGYILLQNFKIDRSTDNWKELAGRIRQSKKEVVDLLKNGQVLSVPFPNTKFTYKSVTKHSHDCALKALESLRLILPYVMALNNKLESVTVLDIDGIETIYKRKEDQSKGALEIKTITVNGKDQEICCLKSSGNENIVIILPITSNFEAFEFDENLPKLFLYYPLIGTQSFGANFVIHSRQFQPTEPRTGLHLSSDNESNEKDEATNREIVRKASELIFEFIEKHALQIGSPISLATINFNVISDDEFLDIYYSKIKSEWIENFKNYPLVETEAGNKRPSETFFLHDELLQDEESFEAIFNLSNLFWKNIPKIDLTRQWTKKINEWNINEITYLGIDDIIKKIEEAGNLLSFEKHDDLKIFYKYLIAQDKKSLFNDFKLLPNIKGDFRYLSGNEGLNSSLNLPEELIEIADVLMPDIPQRHVHPDFKFDLEFSDYSRKNFTAEINEHLSKHLGEKSMSNSITQEFLEKFIAYCKVSTSIDSASVPSKMIKLIARYFNQNEDMIIIPFIKDDELDIRTPQKRLLKLFLNDITALETAWVEENLPFLLEVISTGAEYEAYEELFQTLSVFPTQLNELTIQTYLKIDDNIPDEIKDLYDKVVKPNFPIRANLVHPQFAQYLKNKQKNSVRDLTEKIESKFFDDQVQFSITEHEFKPEILEIIEKIKSNSDYEKHYPLIFSRRSGILVELADGEDTFSILSLDSGKIKKLAELGVNPNFEEIIKLGQEALLQQHQESANFQHKYAIGTHIEKILRESLTTIIPESIKAEIENVQDGQDIIVKINDQAIYFIEVKSRWDINSPIRMSRNQTLRANEQQTNYALCSVDMTKYTGDKKFEVEDIEDIEHCIKFNVDIGYEVAHLISVLTQTNDHEAIHLDGDYRTLIPMKFIEKGKTLKEFEEFITQYLSNK